MHARLFRTLRLCALWSLTIGYASAVHGEVEWMTVDGVATLELAPPPTIHAASAEIQQQHAIDAQAFELNVGAGAPIAYYNLYLNEFAYGMLPLDGALHIAGEGKDIRIDGMTIRIDRNSLIDDIRADIVEPDGKTQLFELADTHSQFDQATRTLTLHAGQVRASAALATALGRPDIAGVNIGTLHLKAAVEWSGGDDPAMNPDNEFIATIPNNAAPRGGGSTPDVVYAECSNVSKYGPIGDMYAYSLASTTCNIGGSALLWGTSNNGTPALAMNAYRIFDGRLEQIGQGWVKNSCCAAAGSQCGLTCSGGGGQQLGAGCSDVYGSGYNGGQSRLGPRSEINAFTGNITPAPSDSGDAIYKRLQVNVNEMMATNYPGAQYLVEGVYVGSDDAAAGNGYNNASYKMANISQSTFDISMLGSMQQGVPAIYAWQDHGNGFNMPDNRVEVQQVDVPGEGIFHIASKVTDNGNGTWHFDYAVYNLNSDRSGSFFSIPIGAANVSDIGFHDVDYHSGEPYDNTDWTITNDGTAITWSSPATFAQNEFTNALRWGTMYNFWFTSDVGPNDEPGEVTLGLFKPGTPSTVSALTQVPLAGAVIIRLPDGAPKITPTCGPTTIAVELKDGSEVVLPQTGKFFYRYDGGAFIETALTPVGGTMYEATLPTPTCNDAPEFYFSARSAQSTLVTNPKTALTEQTYYVAEVGFADVLTYLEADFENGLPANWLQQGLWNVSSTCSGIPSGACQDAAGSQVAYFGQTSSCDFDTGTFLDASMLTPVIALPNVEYLELSYCSALERDTTPVGDWPEVRVRPDGGGSVIVDQPAVGQFPGALPAWEHRVVDLTAFAGQTIEIEFNFRNVFPSNDDKLGWQVDNILLTGPGVTCIPGCDGPDGDANGDNVTDGRDLASIITAILTQSTDPQALSALDFTNDGVVNAADVNQIVDALLTH